MKLKQILMAGIFIGMAMGTQTVKASTTPFTVTCPAGMVKNTVTQPYQNLSITFNTPNELSTAPGTFPLTFQEADIAKQYNFIRCVYNGTIGSVTIQLPEGYNFSNCKFTNTTSNKCYGNKTSDCKITCTQ